jgi:hypothetical protein
MILLADPEPEHGFIPDPLDDSLAAVLMELDPTGRETGHVVGVEIVGFSEFRAWKSIPRTLQLWSIGGAPEGELAETLKSEQRRALALSASGSPQ